MAGIDRDGSVKSKTTSRRSIMKKPIPPPESRQCVDTCFPSFAVMFIFFSCTTLEVIYICPWYIHTYSLETWLPIFIVLSLTSLATIANFSYASYMNPGFLPKAPDLRYLKKQPSLVMVNGIEIHLKHCRTCHYYRMPRTVHCGQCDYCVDNFDHHCPWVNNCVGRRNYRFFFAFLCCLTSHIIVSISMCINYVIQQNPKQQLFSSWNTEKVTAFVVIGFSGLIFMPVFGLLCFHLFLMWRGLSTYEFVTKKYKFKDSGWKNPFDMGPCQNCAFQLCGPEYPIFKSPEVSGDEGSESHDVQRELVVRFAESGHNSDRERNEFSLRKANKMENLAATDDNNKNDVSGGGDNENITLQEVTPGLQADDEKSVKEFVNNNNVNLVGASGDVWCEHEKIIIIPSP